MGLKRRLARWAGNNRLAIPIPGLRLRWGNPRAFGPRSRRSNAADRKNSNSATIPYYPNLVAVMNWRDRSSAIDPAVKTWADHAMAWLVGRFGEERLGGEVILPNVECFPEPYDGSRDNARVLLDRVCNYMDIDPQSFALSFFSQRRRWRASNTPSRKRVPPDFANSAGRTMIWLETSRLADPLSVVATFAHELCHVHLLRGRRDLGRQRGHRAADGPGDGVFRHGRFYGQRQPPRQELLTGR